MSKIDNLNSGELKDILRRLRTLEHRTTLNNAAIGRSGMEVYDEGILNISNGTLLVNGLASITGTFRVSGGSTFTGTLDISGPLTVTGATKLNGQTDIGGNTSVTGDLAVKGPLTVTGATKLDGKTDIGGNTTVAGTLDIKGKSTLQNDLTVQGGGRIKVGASMTLNPATGGGSVEFTNGASVASSGTDLKLSSSNTGAALSLGTQVVMTGGTSSMIMAGSSTNVTTPLFMVDGRIIASKLPAAPAGAKANLYRDPSTGELKQII